MVVRSRSGQLHSQPLSSWLASVVRTVQLSSAKESAINTQAEVKRRNTEQSHAARTAQKQVSFDLEQQRKDRETNAEIQRENAKAAHEMVRSAMQGPTRTFEE